MGLTRRQTMLTLARLEWNTVVHHLENDELTAEASAPALAMLKWRLAQTAADPDEYVTIAQPPLEWSPIIFALSVNVLRKPDLLPVAEHLRDQMAAQSNRMESRLSPAEVTGEMRRLTILPDDLARRILSTN